MVRDELRKRNVDLGKVSVREIDNWIIARLQTLQARREDHGHIDVDAEEMQHLKVYRAVMERMALATHLNSPAILDSLERRRLQSIQRHNESAFEP